MWSHTFPFCSPRVGILKGHHAHQALPWVPGTCWQVLHLRLMDAPPPRHGRVTTRCGTLGKLYGRFFGKSMENHWKTTGSICALGFPLVNEQS